MTVIPKRMQQNFARAAASYDQHARMQFQQAYRMAQLALSLLPEHATILDVGCGTGQFASVSKHSRPGWHIVGADMVLPMCQQAQERCAVVQANALQLPLAESSVDAVVSSFCMQWVNDKPGMLAEMRRVLKPGGLAIVITLGHQTLRELREMCDTSKVALGMLTMPTFNAYRLMAAESGMSPQVIQHRLEVEYYPGVEALLTSMRTIGAGNAQTNRVITPRQFARLIQQYEASYGDRRGIPATWEPILMVLRK